MATLWDYLPDLVPDYVYEITLTPQAFVQSIPVRDDDIEVHYGVGTSEERIIFATQVLAIFTLTWNIMTEADFETLLDWYEDPNKACRTGNSFYYTPPITFSSVVKTYVVRFLTPLEVAFQDFKIYKVATLQFEVLGRKP